MAEYINLGSSIATILTTLIAFVWFIYTRRLRYYENEIKGIYKTFTSLLNSKETSLIELQISHVSSQGWFIGKIDYAEVFKHKFGRSEGECNVIGYIRHNFLLRAITSFKHLFRSSNPFSGNESKFYRGKMYVLMRNDFDPFERDWKDFLVAEYDVIHYRKSYRIKILNKKQISESVPNQLPEKFVVVNTDLVKDGMYALSTDAEFKFPSIE